MSVNELERNETIDRVYTKAKKILKYVNDLVSRDFGIKATARDLRDKAIGKYEKEIDGGVRIVVKLPKQLSSHNKRNDYFILVPEDDAFDDHGELTVFEIQTFRFNPPSFEIKKNRISVLSLLPSSRLIFNCESQYSES